MPRIQTFDVVYPPPERAAAVAAVLREAGWPPEAEGSLNLTLLEDVLMILGAEGGVRGVALYLRTAVEPPLGGQSIEHYSAVAAQVVRVGSHG